MPWLPRWVEEGSEEQQSWFKAKVLVLFPSKLCPMARHSGPWFPETWGTFLVSFEMSFESPKYALVTSWPPQWEDQACETSHLPCSFASCSSCCSVAKLCPILCNPMDCSTPGSSVLHHLPEFAQIHVHRVGDAIQPFHPLPYSSSPVLDLPHYHYLF